MTTGKTAFERVKKEMAYIIKDDIWYKLIFFDAKNNTCCIRETGKNYKKSTSMNTKTYEEACELYNIEIIKDIITPDQYFLTKITQEGIDLAKTIEDRILMNYLSEHKEECSETIDKLIAFVKNGDTYRVRKAAYGVLEMLETDDYKELEKFIGIPEEIVKRKNDIKCKKVEYDISPLYKEGAVVVYMSLSKQHKYRYENIKCSPFVSAWREMIKYEINHEIIIKAYAFAKHELEGKSEDEIREYRNTFMICASRKVPEYLARLARDKNVTVQLADNIEKRLSGFDVMIKESRYMSYRLNTIPFGLSEEGVKKMLDNLPTLKEIVEMENCMIGTLQSETISNDHKRKLVNQYKAPYATHDFKVFMNKFTIYQCKSLKLTNSCVLLCNRVGIKNLSNGKPIMYAYCIGSGKRKQIMKRSSARKKGNIKATKKRKGK